jgi:hypothetical protein
VAAPVSAEAELSPPGADPAVVAGEGQYDGPFAAHPDPKWVAPLGKSLHRLGTELDLGPPAAYSWLADHAEHAEHAWDPWHYEAR